MLNIRLFLYLGSLLLTLPPFALLFVSKTKAQDLYPSNQSFPYESAFTFYNNPPTPSSSTAEDLNLEITLDNGKNNTNNPLVPISFNGTPEAAYSPVDQRTGSRPNTIGKGAIVRVDAIRTTSSGGFWSGASSVTINGISTTAVRDSSGNIYSSHNSIR